MSDKPRPEPFNQYRVEECEHGLVLWGEIDALDFCAWLKHASKRGFTICDASISGHLRAVVAVGRGREGCRKWREELGIEP